MKFINTITTFLKNKNHVLFIAIIVVHVSIAFYFISQQYITYDEPSYIEYSKRWLHGKPDRIEPLDDSKTPVISIVWLPRIVQQVLHTDFKQNDFGTKDQQQGRYMMIFFSLLVLIYLYQFLKLLHVKNWLIAFLFFIIDPLIIAYSVLINSDYLSGLIALATVFHLYKYLYQKSNKNFWFSCIWLATGLVTKHSFLFFIPLYWVMIIVKNKKIDWKKFIQFILLVLLIINVWFYFHHSFKTLGSYEFQSNVFKNIQQNFSWIHWLPLPFPENYIQSLDMLQYNSNIGGGINSTYPGVYLLGQSKLHGGFWNFYIVNAWYKFPLSILILVCTGIFLLLFRFKIIIKKYGLLLLPIVYYFIILSCFNNFQTGVRHLLIIIPLLYVLIAVLINKLWQSKLKFAVIGLWIFMIISVAKFYPDLIPYTNEFIENKQLVYEKIMDTGIDYGQSRKIAKDFLINNPNYTTPSATPHQGNYLVSMREIVLYKMYNDTTLNWLVKNYKPVGLVNHVYLKYKVE